MTGADLWKKWIKINTGKAMKKSIFFALCIISAAACTKEQINGPETTGEFTIEAQAPSFEVTKISLGDLSDKKIPISWTPGDKFALFLLPPENEDIYAKATGKTDLVSTACTYAGEFTTTSSSQTGKFTGFIPKDNVGTTSGVAFFPADIVPESKRNSSDKFSFSSDAIRFNIGAHIIPAEQDGTGIKYLYAAARFKDGELGPFLYYPSLLHFYIPEEAQVTKIVTTTDSSTGLAGPGTSGGYNTAWNLTKDNIISGNYLDKTVTVSNGGILSGDVYVVIRSVNKPSYLQFEFTYDGGKTKTYKQTLTDNLGQGYYVDYGTVFPGSTKIVYKAKDAKYKPTSTTYEFPYCSNSKYYGFGVTDGTAAGLAAAEKTAGEIEWTIDGNKWTTYTTSSTKPYFFTTDSSMLMQIGSGGVLGFPVLSGKKLVRVVLGVSNSEANKKSVKITSDKEGKTVVTGGELQDVWSSHTVTYDLSGTSTDTRYYLKSDTNNIQPLNVTLYYF